MAASDHLGRQWKQPELTFDIHRGIAPMFLSRSQDPEVGKSRVGVHWTASPAVAKVFAGDNGFWGKGTVLHGTAPISHIETDTHTLEKGEVNLKGNLHEKEVPLKKNAPVMITGKDTIKEVPNTGGEADEWGQELPPKYRVRKRTYNPPREMKA